VAEAPSLPGELLLPDTDVPEGRIRTQELGEPRPGVPPVLVIQGMAVSDYLLPACAALGEWTRVALLELPGYGGSGAPRRWLDVRGYGGAVAHWLEATGTQRAVVVGHSSGTQVAAWAGVLCPERVAGVALASPTVDPAARSLPRLPMPVLVLRAERDRLSTDTWVARLTDLAPDARGVRLPGAHAFVWSHPGAWSEPVRELATRVGPT